MLILASAPEEIKMRVKEIIDNSRLHIKLKKLGIRKGVALKVIGEAPHTWFPYGVYKIKVKGETEVLDYHLAKTVQIEINGTEESLGDLCTGDSGTVTKVQGTPEEKELLRELGLDKGVLVEVAENIPNNLLVFEVDGLEKQITSCQAAAIWASFNGEETQLNNLPNGILAKITKVLGSANKRQKIMNMGFDKQSVVIYKRREANPDDGGLHKSPILVEVNGSRVRLNPIDAEQIWVEEILN